MQPGGTITPSSPVHSTSPCEHPGDTLGLRDSFLSPPPHTTSSLWCPLYPQMSPWPPSFTRFVYPCPVAVELPLNLLLAPQLHEGSAVLHALSLFGKLPGEGQKGELRAGLRGSRMPRGLGNHGTESRDHSGGWGHARPSPAKAWPGDG